MASSSHVSPVQNVDSGGSQAPPRGRDLQAVPRGGSLERSRSQGGVPGRRRANPDEATGGNTQRCFRSRVDGNQWAIDVRLGDRERLLADMGTTRRVLDAVLPPADRKLMNTCKTETMVDHMLHEAVKIAFSLLDVRSRINRREEIRLDLLEKVQSAEARERSKDADLRQAQAELERVRKEQSHDVLRFKMAESRANDLEGRARFAEERLKAETEKLSKLKICLRASEKKTSDQAIELINLSDKWRESNSQREGLKTRILELESENQRLEAAAESAEEAARTASEMAREAQRASENALAEFRASSEYEDERAEAGTEMYYDGFNACKAAVANAFPSLNLREILPPGESPSDCSEGEEGDEEVAAAEGGELPIEVPRTSPGPVIPSVVEVEAIPVLEVDSPEVEIPPPEEAGAAAIGSPPEVGEVASSPPQVDAGAASGEREEEMPAIGTPTDEHLLDAVETILTLEDYM